MHLTITRLSDHQATLSVVQNDDVAEAQTPAAVRAVLD